MWLAGGCALHVAKLFPGNDNNLSLAQKHPFPPSLSVSLSVPPSLCSTPPSPPLPHLIRRVLNSFASSTVHRRLFQTVVSCSGIFLHSLRVFLPRLAGLPPVLWKRKLGNVSAMGREMCEVSLTCDLPFLG